MTFCAYYLAYCFCLRKRKLSCRERAARKFARSCRYGAAFNSAAQHLARYYNSAVTAYFNCIFACKRFWCTKYGNYGSIYYRAVVIRYATGKRCVCVHSGNHSVSVQLYEFIGYGKGIVAGDAYYRNTATAFRR